MQGKIIVNADGVVYFGLGSFGTEGTYVTTYWRLDARPDQVDHGESAYWPEKSPYVMPENHRADGASWRVVDADGSYASHPEQLPPAFSETIEVPRPKVRAGTEIRWSALHGWQKWSRKEKGWVPV
jgi:hypothetical protein